MEPKDTGNFLLPGASPDAPYGVLTNGRPRLRPTTAQAKQLTKMGFSVDTYGWKQQPMELAPERREKLQAFGKSAAQRSAQVLAEKKAEMARLYGPDWAKTHKLSELKVKHVEPLPPPDATEEQKKELLIPVKKRQRSTVGKRVAAAVENQLAELRAQNEALQAKIDAAAESARGANEAVTTLAKLARQNSLERKKVTSSQPSEPPLERKSEPADPAQTQQPPPAPAPAPKPEPVFRGGKWF
jgi:hypothetical protein